MNLVNVLKLELDRVPSVARTESTESFEEITSIKSDSTIDLIESTETGKLDEQPEKSVEESEKPSVITDEERAKIEEAVAKQSAAMRQLSQSSVLKVTFSMF